MLHSQPIPPQPESQSIETIDEATREFAREGARSLFQRALETEIAHHLAQYAEVLSEDERKTIVRHGYAPQRTISTGVGAATVQRPRVDVGKPLKRTQSTNDSQAGYSRDSCVAPRPS